MIVVGMKIWWELLFFFLADGTPIFCQLDEKMILNLRCFLLCFQAVSGLNINFNKSELVRLGDRGGDGRLASVLGCRVMESTLPS